MHWLLIASGGALGSVVRFWLSLTVQHRFLSSGFPIGTLSVNILGSLLVGFCYAVISERFAGNELLRAFFYFRPARWLHYIFDFLAGNHQSCAGGLLVQGVVEYNCQCIDMRSGRGGRLGCRAVFYSFLNTQVFLWI